MLNWIAEHIIELVALVVSVLALFIGGSAKYEIRQTKIRALKMQQEGSGNTQIGVQNNSGITYKDAVDIVVRETSTMLEDVSNLKTKVSDVDKEINSQITSISQSLNHKTTEIQKLQQNISTSTFSLNNLKSSISTLENNLQNLNFQSQQLQSQINQKATITTDGHGNAFIHNALPNNSFKKK